MTAATKNVPGERSDAHTGTRTTSLIRKARTVISIMPHLAALWRQRHASRDRIAALEDRARLAEVRLYFLQGQVTSHSLLLGTAKAPAPRDPEPAYGPPAGHPEADSLPLGAADDVMLAGFSLDLWPCDEWEHITADGDLLPVMADVRSCGKCGWTGTGGSCWCPRRTR